VGTEIFRKIRKKDSTALSPNRPTGKSLRPRDVRFDAASQVLAISQPASTGNHPQFPEISFSPITPPKMRTVQSILSGAAESPSTAIPRIAVPAAPIPV